MKNTSAKASKTGKTTMQVLRHKESQELENAAPSNGDRARLLSASSVRAYAASWKHFALYCKRKEREKLPATPDTISEYLAHLAGEGRRAATLTRRLTAISYYHRRSGFSSPTRTDEVHDTLRALRRRLGTRPVQKAAFTIEEIRAAIPLLPDCIHGTRDRALLLVGFAGAFRRSELVSLDVADIATTRQGLLITLRRSKTDQEGAGRTIAIPYGKDPACCPVTALGVWREAGGITTGPLFRPINRFGRVSPLRLSGESVCDAVKRAAVLLGLDPDRYGGHSLRSGLATSAAMAGADVRSIMQQTGHKSREMVEVYVRGAEIWRNNAATKAGL